MYKDRDANRIEMRRWEEIREEWRNYVPNHNSPWPLPEHEVYELPSLEGYLDNLEKDGIRNAIIEEEIPALRISALHESVILIHKGGNTLRAAAEEGGLGYRTWSISTAYHAAFFAMRGVLGLLGVMLFRNRDNTLDYQVDLWSPRAKRRTCTESRFAVRIIRRTRRVQHKEMWGCFSRMLRIVKINDDIFPILHPHPLKNMEPGMFSQIRHRIHYRSSGWIFDDLDNLSVCDDFSSLVNHVETLTHLSTPESNDFPPSLALYIVSMGMALMADLGQNIPKLREESKRAIKWMGGSPWKNATAFSNLLGVVSP